jgi:hypothetical protein
MRLLKNYIINFWIWWYIIKGQDFAKTLWRFWLFSFTYLRIGPMFANLFSPLYQDRTWTGRIIAFPIRIIWGTIGLVLQIILTIIEIFTFVFYLLLPIVPVIETIMFIAKHY